MLHGPERMLTTFSVVAPPLCSLLSSAKLSRLEVRGSIMQMNSNQYQRCLHLIMCRIFRHQCFICTTRIVNKYQKAGVESSGTVSKRPCVVNLHSVAMLSMLEPGWIGLGMFANFVRYHPYKVPRKVASKCFTWILISLITIAGDGLCCRVAFSL